ncbi:MAG: amidohydrolase family protein, partial [Desemzia incerta]
ICDGQHVSYPAISILGKLKGKNRLIMVSDASYLKDYDGPIPEGYFVDAEGSFRNVKGDLASSSLHMNKGLENLIEKVGLPIEIAINAATINPARMLGMEKRKGSIEVGKDADIAILDDSYQVVQTYCKGNPMKQY